MVIKIFLSFMLLILAGCSSTSLVSTQKNLPNSNDSIKVSLFELNNYTDTPQAGKRASSIIKGILLTKGFKVSSHFDKQISNLSDAQSIAEDDSANYFIVGGVSEWRYRTGIDGEPAVSMQLSMYETNSSKLVWSATAADGFGNGSIGTTAQNLVEEMMDN